MLSQRINTPATSHAKSAYGPGSTPRMSGMVAKTPAPTTCVMLTAVACQRPRPRASGGSCLAVDRLMELASSKLQVLLQRRASRRKPDVDSTHGLRSLHGRSPRRAYASTLALLFKH